MENQVGSINFDANQLYLEEDSEHEDDKQQDNEGGLDGILDDDSLLSSSAESSYEDDDANQNQEPGNHFHHQKHSNQHHAHPHHQHHHHQRLQQQQQQQQLNDQEQDLHNHMNNNNINNNINNNNGNNQDQIEFNLANELNDMSIYGPVVAHNSTVTNATPAHQIKNINPNINPNYLINQFSTPANTNAPMPHMLQATLIPTKQEDKMFYTRQRASNEMKSDPESQPQQSQPQPQPQPGNELINQMQQQQQQQQYQPGGVGVEVDNDTLLMEQKTYINPNQYAQPNLLPHHSKLHSMDRFSMRSNQLPPQLIQHQQQAHNHHEQLLENDHELSIENGSDDQDQDDRPVVRNRLMPDESNLKTPTNKLIQIDFNHEANKNDQLMDDYGLMVDLKELDENELKQLKAEEERRQQEEYFSMEHLLRVHCQTQFLYKIRGKKLEEVTNRFTAYQEDMAREMRAMKHRLYLAEKEKDSVQISLDQAHELCNKYKMETDGAVKSLGEQQDKYESLKQTNRQLEKKLAECEQEIESLQMHINEQQKLDTLERVKEQNENFIQKLREQYERDMFQLKEQLAVQGNEINEKNDFIKLMKLELDEMGKNLQEATVERASTVNRLTKSLNELQAKYNQDILIFEHNKK